MKDYTKEQAIKSLDEFYQSAKEAIETSPSDEIHAMFLGTYASIHPGGKVSSCSGGIIKCHKIIYPYLIAELQCGVRDLIEKAEEVINSQKN